MCAPAPWPGSTWARTPDIYLARVNWLPDGKTLAIQRQSRDQRRLDLLFADVGTGKSRVVLTETSTSWIELNDELTFLAKSRRVHLGLEPRRLSASVSVRLRTVGCCAGSPRARGASMISAARAIKGVDEKQRLIYFTATEKSPTERQLYRTSLDTQDPRSGDAESSREDGVHAVTMSRGHALLCRHIHEPTQPPQVSCAPPTAALHRLSRREPAGCRASGRALPRGQFDSGVRHADRRRRPDAAVPAVQARPLRSRASAIRRSSRCTAARACSGCSTTGPATRSRRF